METDDHDRQWLSSELAAPETARLRLPARPLRPGCLDFRLSLSSIMLLLTFICLLAGAIRNIPHSVWLRVGEFAVIFGLVVLLAAGILIASFTFVFSLAGVAWLLCQACALPLRLLRTH